jgi:hypothetical protein
MSNRHPVDQLGDVRAEIRRLQEREEALRLQVIEGKCSLVGDEYRARIKQQSSNRLDLYALRKHFGDRLAPFRENRTVDAVYVERKDERARSDAE